MVLVYDVIAIIPLRAMTTMATTTTTMMMMKQQTTSEPKHQETRNK